MEEEFYQKSWFMWVTLVLFAPVGIFLMWKYDRFSKNTRIALSAVFGLFFIIAITTGKPAQESTPAQAKTDATVKAVEKQVAQQKSNTDQERKNQQEKFQAWYKNFEDYSTEFDNDWKDWQTTFEGVSNGSVSQYTAYDNLNALDKKLSNLEQKFYNNAVPSELSSKHKDLLDKSNSDMRSAISLRRDGIDNAKKFLDDMKPSRVSDAKSSIAEGDKYILSSAAEVTQVKEELGIK